MLLGERLQELIFVDEAARDGDLAGLVAGVLGLVEDFPELIFVDEAEVDEHLADAPAAAALAFAVATAVRVGTGLAPAAGALLARPAWRRPWPPACRQASPPASPYPEADSPWHRSHLSASPCSRQLLN